MNKKALEEIRRRLQFARALSDPNMRAGYFASLADEYMEVMVEELLKYKSAEHTVAADGFSSLSDREREIVVKLTTGSSAGQVAEALDISVHTVRNHLKAIFRKLKISSQRELFMLCQQTPA